MEVIAGFPSRNSPFSLSVSREFDGPVFLFLGVWGVEVLLVGGRVVPSESAALLLYFGLLNEVGHSGEALMHL
jgi:hypothetical protein